MASILVVAASASIPVTVTAAPIEPGMDDPYAFDTAVQWDPRRLRQLVEELVPMQEGGHWSAARDGRVRRLGEPEEASLRRLPRFHAGGGRNFERWFFAFTPPKLRTPQRLARSEESNQIETVEDYLRSKGLVRRLRRLSVMSALSADPDEQIELLTGILQMDGPGSDGLDELLDLPIDSLMGQFVVSAMYFALFDLGDPGRSLRLQFVRHDGTKAYMGDFWLDSMTWSDGRDLVGRSGGRTRTNWSITEFVWFMLTELAKTPTFYIILTGGLIAVLVLRSRRI